MAARTKNRGKAMIRRSTDMQATSLATQLAWCIQKASELGVLMDAKLDDLECMQAAGLSQYKDIYLDDAITGADMTRPGLSAMREDVVGDKSISHIFIYLADRFSRSQNPLAAAQMEIAIRLAGITMVFSNRIGHPRERGLSYFGDDVLLMYEYTASSDYLKNHAQRVIEGQTRVAEKGGWPGGRAPYGFIRVAVDANGTVVQELEDKFEISGPGLRNTIMPKDPEKIRVWVMILNWYVVDGIGSPTIARRLNELNIPSPDFGRTRTDNGVKHKVSGRWSTRTVLTLIGNSAIVGLTRYGVQSEGAYRRFGACGPRPLADADLVGEKPKVIQNDPSIVIVRPTGFEPSIDPKVFEAARDQLDRRGKSQRGISRRRDPSRYPLALRVWDASAGCGHPMYGLTSGKRTLYKCGRYMTTNGAECAHNAVDGDAALTFVLGVLTEQVDRLGGREALRTRLLKMISTTTVPVDDACMVEIQQLEQQFSEAEEELQTINRNLARAKDESESDDIRVERDRQRSIVSRVGKNLQAARTRLKPKTSDGPDLQVERALALYDQLHIVVNNPQARTVIPVLLNQINLRLWLTFGEGRKGSRKVRILKGGILTTGDAAPPLRLYGNNNDEDKPVAVRGSDGSMPVSVGAYEKPSVDLVSQPEDVSFTMVNRGDKI